MGSHHTSRPLRCSRGTMIKAIVITPHGQHEGLGTSGTQSRGESRIGTNLSLGNQDRDDPQTISNRPIFVWGYIQQLPIRLKLFVIFRERCAH